MEDDVVNGQGHEIVVLTTLQKAVIIQLEDINFVPVKPSSSVSISDFCTHLLIRQKVS